MLIACLLPWSVNLMRAGLAHFPLYSWGLVQCRELNCFQMHGWLQSVWKVWPEWLVHRLCCIGKCLEKWTLLLCVWFLCPILISFLTFNLMGSGCTKFAAGSSVGHMLSCFGSVTHYHIPWSVWRSLVPYAWLIPISILILDLPSSFSSFVASILTFKDWVKWLFPKFLYFLY